MIGSAHLLAVLLALGAAAASAVANLFIRIGTDEGRANHAVVVVIGVNALVLLPVVSIVYFPEYGLTPVSWAAFIAAGLLGTLLGRIFRFASIERIGASRTVPIVSSQALFATLLGMVFLEETLLPIHGLGILFVVVGTAVIAWETTSENPDDLSTRELLLGLLLPLAAALAYGWEAIFATVGFAEGTPPAVGLVVKTVAAAGGFLAYLRYENALPTRRELLSTNSRWFVLAGLANTGFLVGYYAALALAPVNVVLPLIITNTLFVVLLSAVFMPRRLEYVTWRLAAAATIAAVGVGLITVVQ